MILLLHKISICFNTSHVVVYRNGTERKNSLGRFQYISCCSLSVGIILAGCGLLSFNTSHVVVYLNFSCRTPSK